MSRIIYNEDDMWAAIRWGGAAKRALGGQRGRAALEELRGALLAMPRQELIQGRLCDGSGVCAIGALGYQRLRSEGKTPREAWKILWSASRNVDAEPQDWAQERLGLTHTLAWEVMERNDEWFSYMSPAERYRAMLGWIDKQLALPSLKRKAKVAI